MWTHLFIHSLGNIPQACYLQEELRCQTTNWEVLSTQFSRDFSFSDVDSKIVQDLRDIIGIFFQLGKLYRNATGMETLRTSMTQGFMKLCFVAKIVKIQMMTSMS